MQLTYTFSQSSHLNRQTSNAQKVNNNNNTHGHVKSPQQQLDQCDTNSMLVTGSATRCDQCLYAMTKTASRKFCQKCSKQL